MDYKKELEDALERARKLDSPFYRQAAEIIFPQLKETADEKILRIIKKALDFYFDGKLSNGTNDVDYAECLAWVNKQLCKKHYEGEIDPKDYKAFYKSELFPEKDIPITDEYLIEHGWNKVRNLSDPEQKCYYFIGGFLNRMYVDRCGKKPIYRLDVHSSGSRRVYTVTDIKIAIYSYVCGLQATKYVFDAETGGDKLIDVDTKEEEDEYRYKKYCEMIKAIQL